MEEAIAEQRGRRFWRLIQSTGAGRSGASTHKDRAAGAGDRFFRTRAHQSRVAERRQMIDRSHPLSVKRQAELLNISRGAVYYLPKPTSQRDLVLMDAIDRLHLDFPFMGSRQLRSALRRQGHDAGRLRIRTLMRKMGLSALAPQPGTSCRNPQHKVFPYLLRKLVVDPVLVAMFLELDFLN